MNRSIELLKQAQGTVFVNQDGIENPFKLLPPLALAEIETLQRRIPCPLPQEVQELLEFSRGFEGTAFDIHFAGSDGFGLEEIFPCAVDIAADGCGNYWVVDLLKDSRAWGPIFYACHDAPVIVFQTESLGHFIEELLKSAKSPWQSEVDEVHEDLSCHVWTKNPGVLTYAQCVTSSDASLRAFAGTLDESWVFIDLRRPRLGDGFSWGRYGSRTINKRFGEERIFAYQRKTLGQRFLDAFQ
jgi:hypothetical protein